MTLGGGGVSVRTIIFHYHLFKNAGTTVDALLQQNFPDRWVTREFPGQAARNRTLVAEWLTEAEDAVVFSSHTAQLPPAEVSGIEVIPVILVRHPIDRIASAYAFERQQTEPSFGSTLARHTDLRGYVATRLALRGDRQCRDFHVHRFAAMFEGTQADELERAIRASDALPFVGVVEEFETSLVELQTLLEQRGFKELRFTSMKRNVSNGRAESLDERLDEFAARIGKDGYDELLAANKQDLEFYRHVVDKRTASLGRASEQAWAGIRSTRVSDQCRPSAAQATERSLDAEMDD